MRLSNRLEDYIPFTLGIARGQATLTQADIDSMCDDDVRPINQEVMS